MARPTREQTLWNNINTTIRLGGGWVTSQPGIRQVRFEAVAGSSLPDVLREANHHVIEMGSHTGLRPSVVTEYRGVKAFKTRVVQPGEVLVYALELPSAEALERAKGNMIPR
jgi:hypothetical protein